MVPKNQIKEGTIKDYFFLGSTNQNKAISQEGIECSISSSYIVIILPLNVVSDTYTTKDIGFTSSLFTSDLKTLKTSMKIGEKTTSSTNPSTFLWISPNNTIQ